MGGKSTRIGTYKCYQCRKPFTVKVGTIFEASHIPMRHWLQAIFLMISSKKGISCNQLHRTLGCTLKTAWFMSHRIREAMRVTASMPPMGSGGKAVEADETFFGFVQGGEQERPQCFGRTRTLYLPSLNAAVLPVRSTLMAFALAICNPIIRAENLSREAQLMTDEMYHL